MAGGESLPVEWERIKSERRRNLGSIIGI